MASQDLNLPRSAATFLVVVGILAFFGAMLVPIFMPEQEKMLAVPLAVMAGVWSIPVLMAMLRGEPWAFVLGLAILIFITDSSFRARTWDDKSIDAQVMLKGAVWLSCGVVGFLRIMDKTSLIAKPPAIFAAALVAFICASSAWSPQPLYTLQAGFIFALMFCFGMAASQVLDENKLLLALAIGGGMIVLPSLAIAPFAVGIAETSPGATGEADRLRGITDHPIPLAETAAVFSFACVALFFRRRGIIKFMLFLLFIAGIVTGLLTQSRLPPAAMVVAALAYWTYRRGGLLLMVPSIILTIGSILLLEGLGGFQNMLPTELLSMVSRSGETSEVLTLSGRLEIWPYVIDRIRESPLLGHGYAAGMAVFDGFVRWKITHSHNLYLQAFLYLGLIGASLLCATLIAQLRVFGYKPSPIRDILLIYMLLKGITEQSVMSNMPSGSVAVWFCCIGWAAMQWNQLGHKARPKAPRRDLPRQTSPIPAPPAPPPSPPASPGPTSVKDRRNLRPPLPSRHQAAE